VKSFILVQGTLCTYMGTPEHSSVTFEIPAGVLLCCWVSSSQGFQGFLDGLMLKMKALQSFKCQELLSDKQSHPKDLNFYLNNAR
jgi:hypothetical protein